MSVRKNSLRSVLDVAVSLVMVAAASTLIYKNVFATPGAENTELKVPSEPVSIAGAQLRGRGDAKAVMIVYSDFQCPFCRRFAREVLPEIERRYVATGHHL
jgi:protein-disulfide isomerase